MGTTISAINRSTLTNTSEEEISLSLDSIPEYRASQVMSKYCAPVLLLLGGFGNVATIFVLRRINWGQSTQHVFLTALAVVDLALLCSDTVGILKTVWAQNRPQLNPKLYTEASSRETISLNRTSDVPFRWILPWSVKAIASLQPYLVVYLKQEGLSASESGVLFGSMPFLSFLVQPLVGAAADRWLKHKAVLVTATILTGLFHLLFLAVPPRTPVGKVLTSDVEFTCKTHHMPVLSFCGEETSVPWASPECVELKKGSGNASAMPGCVADENRVNTLEQDPCPSSVTEVLGLFTDDDANFTSYKCRLSCLSPFAKEPNTRHDICFPAPSGDVPSTCIYGSLSRLPEQSTHGDSTDLTVNNSNNRQHLLRENRCSWFSFSSLMYQNESMQDLICHHDMVLQCSVQCERLDDSGACESVTSTFDLTFGLLYVIYLVAFLSLGAIFPIIDAITYALLEDERHKFGRQRVFGTLGFLTVAVAASFGMYFVTDSGQPVTFDALFYTNAAFCGVAAIIACFFGSHINVRCGNMLKNVGSLLILPKVTAYLIVIFYFGVAFSGVIFLFWFLEDLGAPAVLYPLSTVCSGLSEVPVLFLCGRFIKRFGPVVCMCAAVVAMSARLFAYSLLSNPWFVLLVEPLHGLCFGLFLPSATAYASVVSPPGLAATTQGLMNGMLMGLGRGAGGLLTGWMFSAVGTRTTYRIYAGCGMAAFLVYSLLHRLVFTEHAQSSQRAANPDVEMNGDVGMEADPTRQPLADNVNGMTSLKRT